MKQDETLLEQMFGMGGWLHFNKKIAKKCGNDAALLLGDLIAWRQTYKNKGELEKGNVFFKSAAAIEDSVNIKRGMQLKALRQLRTMNFIDFFQTGIDRARRFKIHDKQILDFLAADDEMRPAEPLLSDEARGEPSMGNQDALLSDGQPGEPSMGNRDARNNRIIIKNKKKRATEITPPPLKTISQYAPAAQKLWQGWKDAYKDKTGEPYKKRDWNRLDEIEEPERAMKYLRTLWALPDLNMKGLYNPYTFDIFTHKYNDGELERAYPGSKEAAAEKTRRVMSGTP